MVEKILNNTTPYGKIRASHEGSLHSSTLSARPHRQFHTLPGLLYCRAALSNSYPNAYVQCKEASDTIFMIVFGMTQPGREPVTYRVKGGHANH